MSDAHSNPAALELALEDAKKRKCDRYVFLGDTTGYGYDVQTTLDLVRRNFQDVIMGNHDAVCCGINNDRYVRMNYHYDIDRAQGQVLPDADLDWLRSLKYTCENDDFIGAHGDFVDPASWGYIIYPSEAWDSFLSCSRDLMFCGHSHHTAVWELKGTKLESRYEERFNTPAFGFETIKFKLRKGARYIVNVGSVGYPRHDFCCSYAIYDSSLRRVIIRRIPFDFNGYIQSMQAAKLELPGWLRDLMILASGR